MIWKTTSIYKFPHSKGGIMIWNAKSLRELRDMLNAFIAEDLECRLEDHRDLLERYGEDAGEYPSRDDLYHSTFHLTSTSEVLDPDEIGLVWEYVDY